MECDMHSFYSAGGVVTFKNLCPLDFMVTERLNLLKSSCRLLSHNSVCVYKSKERYGQENPIHTSFLLPPINIYMFTWSR